LAAKGYPRRNNVHAILASFLANATAMTLRRTRYHYNSRGRLDRHLDDFFARWLNTLNGLTA
jgi:hypothetical protein